MTILTVAAYCIAGVALVRALWGPGAPPHGCSQTFWNAAVRRWRRRTRR